MIQEKLTDLIKGALENLNIEAKEVLLEHPADLVNGDYSTNAALVYAKALKMKPREVAEKIVTELKTELGKGQTSNLERGLTFRDGISKIEIAGGGFINFYLSPEFFAESVELLV